MPLPVPEKRFKHFTVDFIINLPSFINIHEEICINVMIIMNCFSKYTTFIFIQKIDTVSVDYIWLTKFYWENSAPDFIVSDYNLQFISNFWKQIYFHININVKFLTAFHLETDDQTKHINQFLKLYLQKWGDWFQTDWFWWVFITQFAYNNSFHSVIDIISFIVIKNFTPCSDTKILYESEPTHTPNHNQELTDAFICKMTALKTRCQKNIHYI